MDLQPAESTEDDSDDDICTPAPADAEPAWFTPEEHRSFEQNNLKWKALT